MFVSLVVFSALALDKYINSLDDTANKLETVKINLSRMAAESQKIDILLSRVKTSLMPTDFYTKPAEYQIFKAVDDLKSRFTGADVVVTNIEDKGNVFALPVNITGNLKNYADFANNVGYLAGLKFPFFSINSISLSKKQEKDGTAVSYIISGMIRMPKK